MMENDGLADREVEEQEALVAGWQSIWDSGDKAKIAEMELARRISAVTEEDTLEKRVQQVIKEVQADAIISQKLRDRAPVGESVEEFAEAQEAFGNEYRRIVKQAREEVGL